MKRNKKISSRKLIILIIAIILLLIIGIAITMARFRTTGIISMNPKVAFYVLNEGYESGNIVLSGLYPREEVFNYDFTVTNADDEGNVAETSLDYTLELRMTTNLPLEIEIYKNDTKLTSTDDVEISVVLDESGQNYIRKINIKNGSFTFNQVKTDKYTISATFPTSYRAYEEYESMIDHVAIELDAKQKI